MIKDRTARRIAGSWHGGAGSALYALASTGAIDTARADHDCAHEILCDVNERIVRGEGPGTAAVDRELDALLEYVDAKGPRGPIDGWADL